MTKAELDALELISESIQAHKKCPKLQKSLEDDRNQTMKECEDKLNSSMNDLLEAKAKIETDTVTISNLKKFCETQLRKNADLEKRITAFTELNQQFDKLSDEIENSGNLKERLAIVEADNRVLDDENEEQKEIIKEILEDNERQKEINTTLKEDIERLKESNKKLLEDNEDLKETNKTLTDDIEGQKEINTTLKEDIRGLKEIIKALRKDNEGIKEIHKTQMEGNHELKEIVKKVLEDNESVQRRLKEVETKLTFAGK